MHDSNLLAIEHRLVMTKSNEVILRLSLRGLRAHLVSPYQPILKHLLSVHHWENLMFLILFVFEYFLAHESWRLKFWIHFFQIWVVKNRLKCGWIHYQNCCPEFVKDWWVFLKLYRLLNGNFRRGPVVLQRFHYDQKVIQSQERIYCIPCTCIHTCLHFHGVNNNAHSQGTI